MKRIRKILLILTSNSNKKIKDYYFGSDWDGIYLNPVDCFIKKNRCSDFEKIYDYVVKEIKKIYRTMDKEKEELYIVRDIDFGWEQFNWNKVFNGIKNYKNIVFLN